MINILWRTFSRYEVNGRIKLEANDEERKQRNRSEQNKKSNENSSEIATITGLYFSNKVLILEEKLSSFVCPECVLLD